MNEKIARDDTELADPHEEASAWFLALRKPDCSVEAQAGFEAWRAKGEANARAYADVENAWGLMDDAGAAPEIVTARRDALSRARRAARFRWGRDRWPRLAAVAATLLVTILAAPLLMRIGVGPSMAGTTHHYETDIGETRVLTLADNSKISLDAKTALNVRYTPHLRLIDLRQGQAYFDVAKDPARPFRVTAGGKTVVALGTAFNVEIVNDEVFVTLVEGKVAVTDAADVDRDPESRAAPDSEAAKPPSPVQELVPGQRLAANAAGLATIDSAADIAKTTAWRRGKLIFEDEPLSLAIERMNRYSRITIVAGDRAAATLGVSGVFDAGDTDAFVEALEDYFGATVSRREDGAIVIHAPA
jgi:transmembrane sensor